MAVRKAGAPSGTPQVNPWWRWSGLDKGRDLSALQMMTGIYTSIADTQGVQGDKVHQKGMAVDPPSEEDHAEGRMQRNPSTSRGKETLVPAEGVKTPQRPPLGRQPPNQPQTSHPRAQAQSEAHQGASYAEVSRAKPQTSKAGAMRQKYQGQSHRLARQVP